MASQRWQATLVATSDNDAEALATITRELRRGAKRYKLKTKMLEAIRVDETNGGGGGGIPAEEDAVAAARRQQDELRKRARIPGTWAGEFRDRPHRADQHCVSEWV